MEKARDRNLKIARYLKIAIGAALIGGATFAGIAYYDKFSESGGFKTFNSAVTQNKMVQQPLKVLEMSYLLGGGYNGKIKR